VTGFGTGLGGLAGLAGPYQKHPEYNVS